MAFAPLDSIEDAIEVIYDKFRYGQKYAFYIPVLESFEKTYLGTLDVNGRSGAIFDPKDWNFYDDIVNGFEFPRTNNCVEGFHRGFKDRFTGSHPPMFKFANAIKQQQRCTDFDLNRMDFDISIVSSRKKKKIVEDDLKTLAMNFPYLSMEDYTTFIV